MQEKKIDALFIIILFNYRVTRIIIKWTFLSILCLHPPTVCWMKFYSTIFLLFTIIDICCASSFFILLACHDCIAVYRYIFYPHWYQISKAFSRIFAYIWRLKCWWSDSTVWLRNLIALDIIISFLPLYCLFIYFVFEWKGNSEMKKGKDFFMFQFYVLTFIINYFFVLYYYCVYI